MSVMADKCKDFLEENGIDIRSEIDFEVNEERFTLSFEYIVDTYMRASEASQLAFLEALQSAVRSDNNGAKKFFEGMGQLLLMTHLSKNIEMP